MIVGLLRSDRSFLLVDLQRVRKDRLYFLQSLSLTVEVFLLFPIFVILIVFIAVARIKEVLSLVMKSLSTHI